MVDTNKLKSLMVSKGYTQQSISREIGYSSKTLSRKMNGKSPMDTITAEKLCKALGIIDGEEKAAIFFKAAELGTKQPKPTDIRKGEGNDGEQYQRDV